MIGDTTMRAAFRKVGVDDTAELKSEARRLLQKNGNDPGKSLAGFIVVLKKDPKLLRALALQYLCQVSNLGQLIGDAQGLAAETAAADHATFDAQISNVGGGTSSDRSVHVKKHQKNGVKEFWRHPQRTETQKEAARTAMLVGSSLWRQFGMEKLRYRELDAFIRDHANSGATRILLGTSDMQRAVFALLVKKHAVPTDETQLVSEIVGDNDLLSKLAAQALTRGNEIAKELVPYTAQAIEQKVKLIAAE